MTTERAHPRTRTLRGVVRHLAGLALAACLLAVALPTVAGLRWSNIVDVLTTVPPLAILALVTLWLSGLVAHTVTLTAALPTLSHRRALTLSLTGSAVANVLPLGGAAGLALNYRMLRSWGYGAPQFSTYTVITNVWDVLAKLVLPLVLLPVLLLGPPMMVPHLTAIAISAASVLALLAVVTLASVTSRTAARTTGRLVDAILTAALRAAGSTARPRTTPWLVDTQAGCRDIITDRWARLTIGIVCYNALLLSLLVACLHVTAAALPLAVVLIGFCVERLVSLANLTPGGAGVVELGLAGTLVLLGGDAVTLVPGVLLYRTLTFALEIPVGGGALLGWALARRSTVTAVAAPRPGATA